MPTNQFAQIIGGARWASAHRFIVQVVLHIRCKTAGGFIAPTSLLLERFHHNPIEVSSQRPTELFRFDAALCGDAGQAGAAAEAHTGFGRPAKFGTPLLIQGEI